MWDKFSFLGWDNQRIVPKRRETRKDAEWALVIYKKTREGESRLSSVGAKEMSQSRKTGDAALLPSRAWGGRGHSVFAIWPVGQKSKKKKKNKRRLRNFIRQAQGQRKNNNWRGWTTVSPHPFPKRGMKYEFFFPIGKYSTRDAQYVTCELRNSRR